jgi:large subunit ribosomal protein L19|tara:strand:- start:18391 stop:18795 length:405 start_codon:yes stop_codon:yes gene_type:complete
MYHFPFILFFMTSKSFSQLEFSPFLKNQNFKQSLTPIDVGDSIRFSIKIKEGNKERIQISEGLVIAKKTAGINSTVTVRRIVQGIGLERTYLLHSPLITNINILRKSKVRRSKLYYLRSRFGKASRLKQSFKKR